MLRRVRCALGLVAAMLVGGGGCKVNQPVAPAVVPPQLVVLNALWGVLYEGQHSDVTALLSGRIHNDALSVPATTDLLGEPARDKVKQLRVVYQQRGVVAKKFAEEGTTLTIASDEQPVPLRLIVTKAVYGDFASGRTVDVTLRLADMVKDNKLSVGNYNSIAGDPAFKRDKELRLEYTIDGRAQAKTFAETEPLALAVPPSQ